LLPASELTKNILPTEQLNFIWALLNSFQLSSFFVFTNENLYGNTLKSKSIIYNSLDTFDIQSSLWMLTLYSNYSLNAKARPQYIQIKLRGIHPFLSAAHQYFLNPSESKQTDL